MATILTRDCAAEEGLERVRFFPGQVLNADDMTQNTEWVRQKQRRHNRNLHGWGIVCGCDVRPPSGTDKAWQVHICPGYLLTPQGDEVFVAAEVLFDIADCSVRSGDPCAFARPCPPIGRRTQTTKQIVYLCVRYLECETRPVRGAPIGCGCEDAQCDYSRIREAYEFCCLDSAPPTPPPYGCDHLCRGDVLACTDCPPDPAWVLLATVTLPPNMDTGITDQNIGFGGRRLLYSTAMLQEMALCACAPSVVPTPTPTPSPTPTPPPLPQVATPVINPPSGSFAEAVNVTMTDNTAGATIYYSIDGPDPDDTSTIYAGNFAIPRTGNPDPNDPGLSFPPLVVKAIAYAPGYRPSQIASVSYRWIFIT